jgi:hypothetical protein
LSPGEKRKEGDSPRQISARAPKGNFQLPVALSLTGLPVALRVLASLHGSGLLARTLIGLPALAVTALLLATLRAVALILPVAALLITALPVALSTLLVRLSGLVSLVIRHLLSLPASSAAGGHHGPSQSVQFSVRFH